MTTTDTTVNNLIINTMTQAQYATITPSDTELYLVTDGVLSSSDVTDALGYTPYSSTNPSGYQANVLETVKVNGTALTPSSKTVSLTVPTSTTQLTNDSGFITGITSSDVTTALGYTPADTYSTTNPALTSSNSICTWAVTHNLGDNVEVQVYNSSDKKVLADVTLTSSTVATVELFSTSNISAGAYKVVVIGK